MTLRWPGWGRGAFLWLDLAVQDASLSHYAWHRLLWPAGGVGVGGIGGRAGTWATNQPEGVVAGRHAAAEPGLEQVCGASGHVTVLILLPCMGASSLRTLHTHACWLSFGQGTHCESTISFFLWSLPCPASRLGGLLASGGQQGGFAGYYPTLQDGSQFTDFHFAGDEKAHICLL